MASNHDPHLGFPSIEYLPRDPQTYRPAIGLIGCGGITKDHLTAYRSAGYNVVALCDIDAERADLRRREYFPEATVFQDYRDLLNVAEIEVVDIATHPPSRPPIIQAALEAKKHVLSQKPFVLDLDMGEQLVSVAEQNGVKLAVNQNGRWAPHFSYLRGAVDAGYLGAVSTAHLSVHWDHTWVTGTEFENVRHLILYDYAIHWFDMIECLFADRDAKSVYATAVHSQSQTMMPPLLAQAMVQFDDAQASLAFDADTKFGSQDRTYVTGSAGTFYSVGPGNKVQTVTLSLGDDYSIQPHLKGSWFPDGFHGTMGELLCSIEEDRTPSIDARRNLRSLALCFAAVASAERGEPVIPGSIRRLPE